ncbi:unnamed protein product [Paramecium sonneborni]|uniref:Uncharacterized protein n=1 Tax=Paramecium sonneborni TaxID=65129 RepID=A0A8S1RHT5_9CILI|nr:unnamed protein product [Paramecium sonneborni]
MQVLVNLNNTLFDLFLQFQLSMANRLLQQFCENRHWQISMFKHYFHHQALKQQINFIHLPQVQQFEYVQPHFNPCKPTVQSLSFGNINVGLVYKSPLNTIQLSTSKAS